MSETAKEEMIIFFFQIAQKENAILAEVSITKYKSLSLKQKVAYVTMPKQNDFKIQTDWSYYTICRWSKDKLMA